MAVLHALGELAAVPTAYAQQALRTPHSLVQPNPNV
jgi:hypothetical protein